MLHVLQLNRFITCQNKKTKSCYKSGVIVPTLLKLNYHDKINPKIFEKSFKNIQKNNF